MVPFLDVDGCWMHWLKNLNDAWVSVRATDQELWTQLRVCALGNDEAGIESMIDPQAYGYSTRQLEAMLITAHQPAARRKPGRTLEDLRLSINVDEAFEAAVAGLRADMSSAFYGWPDRPAGGVLNPTCTDHVAIDNGTRTSECRHCRQRMVFDFPEWKVTP